MVKCMEKYIDTFRQDIVQMFNTGEKDKAKRRGPAETLKELNRFYSESLDLPSETEIRTLLSFLMVTKRKASILPWVQVVESENLF